MTYQVRFIHKLQQVKVEDFATQAEAFKVARAWAGSRQEKRLAAWHGLLAVYSSGRWANKAEVSGPHAEIQP